MDVDFCVNYWTKWPWEGKNFDCLPTSLPDHLWSNQFSLASRLGCTLKIEHKNKTQTHDMLSVGHIQQHIQAAPLSYI